MRLLRFSHTIVTAHLCQFFVAQITGFTWPKRPFMEPFHGPIGNFFSSGLGNLPLWPWPQFWCLGCGSSEMMSSVWVKMFDLNDMFLLNTAGIQKKNVNIIIQFFRRVEVVRMNSAHELRHELFGC